MGEWIGQGFRTNLGQGHEDLDAVLDEGVHVEVREHVEHAHEAVGCLAPEAPVLLLDEHTAALDPKSADQVISLSDEVIRRDGLTTLMVTHSMAQAVAYGDRIIMMHRGQVVHDFRGAEKRRLRQEDLIDRFDEIRRREQLDEGAAAMLRELYV